MQNTASASPTSSRLRVLVVEDEYFIADDLARALARHGAQVIGPIPRFDAALDWLKKGEPLDCAVLDVNLRGQPVFPVAAGLRGRGTPFVFVTGYESDTLPPEFRDAPCWEKPVDPEALARWVVDMEWARSAAGVA